VDYLVTGGAGFIGSNIVRRLLETGKSVRVLDDLSTGRAENLDGVWEDIDFIEGDIRKVDTAAAAVAGVRNVLHVGALPSVVRSVDDPMESNDVNVCGTLTMLVAARDAGVKRFVFSSSSSVYGDTEVLPKQEDMKPMPLSPYAAQKLMGENYCRVFHDLYGLETFALRYFNVFGPRQNPASQYAAVIPLFIDALRNDRAPVIFGDGEQTRDFTFVADVVKANICCCTAPSDGAGGVYNVARGDRVSVNTLAETLMSIMGKNLAPVYEAGRPGDVRDSQADSGRAREMLGWESGTTFDEGLRKTVRFFVGA